MIVAVLQARMTSTRLPGKVLAHIDGTPMILGHLERVSRSKLIDKIWWPPVLIKRMTSWQTCSGNKIIRFSGAAGDNAVVITRRPYPLRRSMVRLTGDCPLADPEIIDS